MNMSDRPVSSAPASAPSAVAVSPVVSAGRHAKLDKPTIIKY